MSHLAAPAAVPAHDPRDCREDFTRMTSIPDSLARRPWFTFAGTLLLAAAALPSNLFVEQAFGRAPHSLAWGPALFRALLALHGLLLLSTNFLPRERPAAPSFLFHLASEFGRAGGPYGPGCSAAHSKPELLHVAG